MEVHQLLLSQHARAHAAALGSTDISLQDQVLDGMTERQMRQRVLPGVNSIAWLLWHVTRGEDIGVNAILAAQAQVIECGTWGASLGVAQVSLGAGMSDDEVDAFGEQIDCGALLDYRAAVGRQTREILSAIDPAVLDQTLDAWLIASLREAGVFHPAAAGTAQRWLGKTKAFTLTYTVLGHTLMHLGQAGLIRGLLGLPSH